MDLLSNIFEYAACHYYYYCFLPCSSSDSIDIIAGLLVCVLKVD